MRGIIAHVGHHRVEPLLEYLAGGGQELCNALNRRVFGVTIADTEPLTGHKILQPKACNLKDLQPQGFATTTGKVPYDALCPSRDCFRIP